ncbi:Sec-independent protein translocase protein TatB [Halofilum ochraceum]|uniref:Sec-independent protein translocase protein TatB n=1 Tax=Halofilum ochraceum TaxID=1611323 RepID=UPI0008DA554E|nr:Sec-independent protein translocase protein TatB [Halofilum ochraceum]
MFDIGFWEILLIGVVTLLVVGPQRLPGVAVFAGHWIGRIRRFVRNMRDEINEELETEHLKSLLAEQNREISELRKDVDAVRGDTERSVREAGESVRQAEDQVREADPSSAEVDGGAATTGAGEGSAGSGSGAPADRDSGEEADTDSSTRASTRAGNQDRDVTDEREEGPR